jgi:hypothetical protein
MKAEFEKCMLITSELIAYCHLRGADDYHLDLKVTKNETAFKIKAAPTQMDEEEMKLIIKKLNAPRQRDIEQEYWDVMGESEIDCEMTLVGMLCDGAEVEYQNGELTIGLKRYINGH